MEHKQMIDMLNSLVKLDIDAVNAYTQAIKEIDFAAVRQRIETFRNDHERHITDLSQLIQQMGGTPTEHKKDIKGYLIEGFTAIRSKMGTEGALKAMKTNEQLTNKRYSDARSAALSGDARALVDRNYEDERRHLEYIEHALHDQVWKH